MAGHGERRAKQSELAVDRREPLHSWKMKSTALSASFTTRLRRSRCSSEKWGYAASRKREAFRFFRQLLNYDPATVDAATLTHDAHLDYFVADSAVECNRDHLLVGRRMVRALSMKEPPSQTFAHLLADLYEVPGELIACLEWQRIPSDRMRRDIPDTASTLLQ